MKKENLIKVLVAPLISEKATKVEVDNQYVFQVIKDATKEDIAAAVKLVFNVDVDSVRVCNVKGKTRRFGNIQGSRKCWKKAYITLKEGQVINFGGA